MVKEQVIDKLKQYGQMHLLHFYDELSEEEQQCLLREIDRIDFDSIRIDQKGERTGIVTPIGAMTLEEIEKQKDSFREAGLQEIREGRAAAVLLAGGQGTRLGFDGPKGTLNVGITKELYIFQCLVETLLKVKEAAGTWIPLLVMTSDKNDAATRSFFETHDYFGYDKEHVFFFIQEMVPSTDFDGKVYLEEKGHVSLSPNGNGGWFISLKPLLEKIKGMGVQWLNVFAVDNVLKMGSFILGATVLSGQPVGAKVVRKAPDEKWA